MNTRTDLLKSFRTATAAAALMTATAGMAIALVPVGIAAAQDHGGGHDSGDDHEGGQGQRGGQGRAPGEASEARGHRSMEDIFRDVAAVEDDSDRPVWAGTGRRGTGDVPPSGEEEDSDRPEWAGGGGGRNDRGEPPSDAGSARGDLYGDLYVILRDENGVPILNEDGFVQPIDADGNLIPLDEEGAPIDPTLVLEVELGRLNVGRSPTQVLDRRAQEVVTLLSTATAVSTDTSGRIVITSPDGTTKTIDSPLENLAIYVALMTTGTIPGVTDLPGTEYDFLVDGQFTVEDIAFSVGLLAASADKYVPISADKVAYMNAILGISTTTVGSVTYSDLDYSSFSYDRSDTYGDDTVTILVRQPDGSYIPTPVNVFEEVFGGVDYSATGTFSAFAQAIDDSRAVLAFIHDNEAPE